MRKEKKPILKNVIVGIKVLDDNHCSLNCHYMCSAADHFCSLLGTDNTVLLNASATNKLKRTKACKLREIKAKQK